MGGEYCRSQKSEVRSQKGWKSEVGKSEVGSGKLEVGSWKLEVGSKTGELS
jgi:hypothetical protein